MAAGQDEHQTRAAGLAVPPALKERRQLGGLVDVVGELIDDDAEAVVAGVTGEFV
jgi:hypothetical protein